MKISKKEELDLIIEALDSKLNYLRQEDYEGSEEYLKILKIKQKYIKKWMKVKEINRN